MGPVPPLPWRAAISASTAPGVGLPDTPEPSQHMKIPAHIALRWRIEVPLIQGRPTAGVHRAGLVRLVSTV